MLKSIFLDLIKKFSDNDDYNLKCWNEIFENYTLKNRPYHNLAHLQKMLSEYETVKDLIDDFDTLLFSIFYHDIIYKSTSKNNEHKSALFCKERLLQTTFQNVEKCFSQIMANKNHAKTSDADTNYLLDFDLAILGSDPKDYEQYSIAVRKEYQIYPNFIYNKGRLKVLQHFLKLEQIFKTDFFIDKYEAKAVLNLENEVKMLNFKF